MKKIIAELKSARIDTMDINNAFDLRLYQLPDGNYELVVFMKLQFFFKDNHPHQWEDTEQDRFIRDWQDAIHKFWGNKIIHALPAGETVWLSFDFHVRNGGWMFDHWEITVTKIAPQSFKVSFVDPDWNNVQLDSQDLVYTGSQRGAIHEFGHMIGLPDEYKNSRHIIDLKSVMHSGEELRPRHYGLFADWVERTLSNTLNEIS